MPVDDTRADDYRMPCYTDGTQTPTGSAPERCIVPKLKGKTLAAARKAVMLAHCALGKVTNKHVKKAKRGRVLRQSPSPGTIKPNGAKVSVVIQK